MSGFLIALLIVAEGISAEQRNLSFHVHAFSWDMQSLVGTPQLMVRTRLSTQFAELILIDKMCGIRKRNCSHHCDDLLLIQMYCDPLCLPVTAQSQYIYCGSLGERYEALNSSTARRLGHKWSSQVDGSRRLLGELWTDSFALTSVIKMKHPEVVMARMGGMPVMSAALFDRRLLSSYLGIFGLKPGANSPAMRIFETQRLRRRILTAASGEQALMELRPQHSYTVMKMGSLDGAHCVDWQFVPAVSEHDWVVRVDSFDLLGFHFDEEILLSIKFDNNGATFPSFATDRMVAAKKLFILSNNFFEAFYYSRTPGQPCVPPGPTKFRIGKVELVLADSILHWAPLEKACLTNMMTDAATSDAVWAMGTQIFNEHCLAFDYDRHMIGFARRRKRSILIA